MRFRHAAHYLLLISAGVAWAAAIAASEAELDERYRSWLEEVEPLLLDEEREAFMGLRRDHHRESFVRGFWEERDPYPETGLNELEGVWRLRVDEARHRFGGLDGERARLLLLAGPPDRVDLHLCPELVDGELWEYRGDAGGGSFAVLLVRDAPGRYRIWDPIEGLRSLVRSPGARFLPSGDQPPAPITASCPGARDLEERLRGVLGPLQVERLADRLPRPSPEWVGGFLARLPELPEGAEPLAAELTVSFPGRRQSRTVVQGLIAIDAREAAAPADPLHYHVDGEILRKGSLFERFRYRFDSPPAQVGDRGVPLVVQRFLRPGAYTLVLRVHDLATDRYFRAERRLDVPVVRRAEREPTAAAAESPSRFARASLPPAAPAAPADPFAEANAMPATEAYRLKILQPRPGLLLGPTRIEAIASGEAIRKVAFRLDGRELLRKLRPPFSVEVDLGEVPRVQTLEAIGYDAAGRELARDELELNAGPHRFAVRLVEPRPDVRYRKSARVEAEVEVPEGERLDRVELWLDETRLATLYQPPFVQPLLLPPGDASSYVRAVAYLEDGNSTEDLVFVNAPEHLDRLRVDFVELYASVVDAGGRPVDGLRRDDFTVLEDGAAQPIRRFERVRDLPLHAGLVLDASTSMAEELLEAERAAIEFFQRVIQPRDRAAVIVFNERPELRVPFTNDVEVLAGALSGIRAEGHTALYDTLVYGLYYFGGIRGRRALVLLSDGADSSSRHSFDEALEFARRSGVAIYAIGLDLDSRDVLSRNVLLRLARDTGGRSFFIRDAGQLERIYAAIEEELRSQYLIGYQSPQTGNTGFRKVELRLASAGLEAKTIPGYYP